MSLRQPVGLMLADKAMGHFLRSEHREFTRIGYPRQAAFAGEIAARGDLGLPPPTEDDPLNEAVGKFYHSVTLSSRQILVDNYLPDGSTQAQRAARVGKSVRSWKRALRKLTEGCMRWLKERGL